ncbi:CYCLIC NUCLEOTIDE GATED CHANNEL 2, DEFENSE NO DEATH 1, CYCLIC NUCLEOTIDE-GATED CHANNEL 2 [Hibiscus trionum]|uniref:CYCLIC NUCLEOTIDE GATED CHANNEL 2, DEFENSE NO DEATH 1, CYCLIC NUCLEOTIDE-GATED CHANNEL 2 n=1 Tax=Hibiscus trionum TaxID=183268 RepID=A0A9W7H142_HIBTR|nr:CYCLIC NUCLEOTIDE GATED CHANNEL 2, DEFENSE NO DEATH 1, CYCLIC NUCLEOTIDE-GATED CHANNEL 2 [Hibiscus trionum]
MIFPWKQITREGDPVQRMVFIVRGRMRHNQSLSKGMVTTSTIEPGEFFGDELLSWCLRRPFKDRLPASSATFVCIEPIEAFGLDANHLRYLTDHFRYKFANERLKRTARYYSSNWRTWAAVNIQFFWRRYRTKTKGLMISSVQNGNSRDHRLLQYAALFMSIRPHDHLE